MKYVQSTQFSDINSRLVKVKTSMDERNQFIEEYKPFIISVVQKVVGRYVTYGVDEELSIGLIAFNEAINQFNQAKGNFLVFAQHIIRMRLIDYYRKEKKHHVASEYIPTADDNKEISIIDKPSLKTFTEQELSTYRSYEIMQLKQDLAQWNISLMDVQKSSPKHQSTKQTYQEIIKYLYDHPQLVEKMQLKRIFPIGDIEESTKIPRKTIERSRNYVIANIIILFGEYEFIREYVQGGWEK